MTIGLVITVGGNSRRFKAAKPKQYVLLHERPVVLRALDCFLPFIDHFSEIVFTTNQENAPELRRLLSEVTVSVPIRVIQGGKTRCESVRYAVEQLATNYVMIHDGVRPIVSEALIMRLLGLVKVHDAIIPGLPSEETVKMVRQNIVTDTLNRDDVFRIQTPQLFKKSLLQRAYSTHQTMDATEEASLVESLTDVHVVLGEKSNIKITTVDDIRYVTHLLSEAFK